MQLVPAAELFKQACQALEGKTEDGQPCARDLDKSEALLHEILNNNIANIRVLYTLGSLYLTKGNPGLAIQLLHYVTQADPNFGEAWNNLGLAYKEVNLWDKAAKCADRAAALIPHPDIPCNAAATFLNRGTPERALEWVEKALALDPDHVKSKWHKAMALLEMGKFEEAWDWHESRLEGGGNYSIAERDYHDGQGTPWWDGSAKGTVVIHGEQGMGDEIMFASCISDALATGANIVLEPSPRLEGLFRRSFPDAFVFGTDRTDGKGWVETRGKPDFKCAIASLPKFWRRSKDAFPGTPYLVPCPKKKAQAQGRLWGLGSRPKIGIAWQGGVASTRIDARSFHPRLFVPLFRHDADFVSLQYDKGAKENVVEVLNETGTEIHHWPEWVEARVGGKPSDIDDLAALISCLDLVITVPMTAYHVSGAIGIPTWVLTPSEADWRLMTEGETNPWYGCVTLIRQPKGTRDWHAVIAEADRRLEQLLSERHAEPVRRQVSN